MRYNGEFRDNLSLGTSIRLAAGWFKAIPALCIELGTITNRLVLFGGPKCIVKVFSFI